MACLHCDLWHCSHPMISLNNFEDIVSWCSSSYLLRNLKPFLYLTMCICAQSCLTLCNSMDCSLPGSLSMGFSRQKYWSGLPFPTPRIFPTKGLNPWILRLLHWQADSLSLSYLGYLISDLQFFSSLEVVRFFVLPLICNIALKYPSAYLFSSIVVGILWAL